MKSSREWGLTTYEQDWLDDEFDKFLPLTTSATLGRTWLLQMGTAAANNGISIQYCMSHCRHMLASVEIPAVTHVDYSARIQTVHQDTNPRYHAVISKFKEKTGCPIVVNTSFNVRGEPIICSPTDAFKCFMGTDLDVLAVGGYLLVKEQQDQNLKKNYEKFYELD